MTNSSHRLAAGVVIEENGSILLVRDKHGWSLPKGSVEPGEVMKETAEREAKEETGLEVELLDVAFITEYTSLQYGRYLQVYYHACIINHDRKYDDPDKDIKEIRFIPKSNLKDYITFKPWIHALEEWIREPVTKYNFFDLDKVGFYL